MQLYSHNKNKLVSIDKNSFKFEKEIQSLVEGNLDTLFNLEFVCTEFTIGDFRLDTLAYDVQNNSFVIIEYKRGSSYSVVDQGYSYLSVMLNNKADFILEYNEKSEKNLRRNDVDWTSSRVVFVSPSFNSYQLNSVNFKDVPFELWEIKKFDNNLVAVEQCKSSSKESIDKLTKNGSQNDITKVTSEVKVYAEDDIVEKANKTIKQIN